MKIGLVGNQNSGKTTLFNCLTGMNAKIGNWPGVTIEKKVGKIKGTNYEIIDLPGIYSLSPYTTEEEVARRFIFEENPDVIINIIDATALERSLYLTTQLLELDCNIIIALNMSDMLLKKGLKIDVQKLSEKLGTKVVKISALKEQGISELIKSINETLVIGQKYYRKNIYDTNIENTIKNIQLNLPSNLKNKRFISVKMIEYDNRFKKYNTQIILDNINKLSEKYDIDVEEVIATQRYLYIENVKKECITQKIKKETTTDKLDKIFLNKWIAFPIFIVIMFFIYYLSVGVIGKFTVDYASEKVEQLSTIFSEALLDWNASEWLISLIIDGIIAGIGTVLGFVPQLIILFLCISFLETTGYMSRIALLLDRVFRKVGLSGKSLIPFVIGSGCSVPGIMGTRIIENDAERKMTAILTPFIPCSAKLPIIALFSGYFFKENSGVVSASLYFLAIVVIIFSSIIMKKFVFKTFDSTYILELPDYKIPSIKYIAKDVFDKVISFIKRAGSVIFICSIIIWCLLSFSCNLTYGVNIENSILASIGKTISWVFYPIIGKNSWEVAVSAIQGLIAKEQVVSSMAVISGIIQTSNEQSEIFANEGAFYFFTKSSAYAFMVFNLFSAPCFGAIGAMKRELGGIKNVLKAVVFQTILAWCLSSFVYQIGIRIEEGVLNLTNIFILFVILCLMCIIILSNIKNKNSECNMCPYTNSCNKN